MLTKTNRVVVTGIGPICSLGIGKDDFWRGLIKQEIRLEKVKYRLDDTDWITFVKHRINDFNIDDFQLDRKKIKDLYEWKENEEDYDLFLLLAAAHLAIKDSKLEYDTVDNNIGLIVSHENPGLEQYFTKFLRTAYLFFSNGAPKKDRIKFYDFMYRKMVKSSVDLQTFMPLFHIAKILGLHGYSLFINNACASGGYAFEEAKRIIREGVSEAVVIVSGDLPQAYKYLWFHALKMYAEDGISKPFCRDSGGLVFGDGATGIILEDLEHAQKRKAPIYAEYVGGSFSSEGWKVTLPDINGRFYERNIKKVLDSNNMTIEKLDMIVPHGVGTPISDQHEIQTFNRLFKKKFSQIPMVPLKPYFGHNLGGNVLLEVAAIMIMFQEDCVLPALHYKSSNYVSSDLCLLDQLQKKRIAYALKTTCAFAGFNSALMFKKMNNHAL